MKGLFVTGTDTGCGKTEIAAALMRGARARGERVVGMKPVASGARRRNGRLVNDDALRLLAEASVAAPYEAVNPYCFEPAIAPHLAAAAAGVVIDAAPILAAATRLAAGADRLIVEGVGGWRVPLGDGLDVAALAARLGLPVVLVVGLRLGCLNHALLSVDAIIASGCRLAGWVANAVDPQMAEADANIATLSARLGAPIATVAALADGDLGRLRIDPVIA